MGVDLAKKIVALEPVVASRCSLDRLERMQRGIKGHFSKSVAFWSTGSMEPFFLNFKKLIFRLKITEVNPRCR